MILTRTDVNGHISIHATSKRISVYNSDENHLKLHLFFFLNFYVPCQNLYVVVRKNESEFDLYVLPSSQLNVPATPCFHRAPKFQNNLEIYIRGEPTN